ncbi:MAG: cytidine deaminase [Bacilli bacterium]|nr:cytidine deaminase [Bacilli bacterium]
MKEKLLNELNNSYSPYSKFRVSAIVVMKDGKEFVGTNVENASYGACICAERVAITSAIADGYKKGDFDKLYVMVDSDKISSCCFMCRQVITEFYDKDSEIILSNNKGDFKTYTVSELCPVPFNEEDLK